MDRGLVLSCVRRAALSPPYGSRSLVRTNVWLAADGFSMGAACPIYMGFLATLRDLRSREGCIQHFSFPRTAAGAPSGAGRCHGAAQHPEGFHGNTDARFAFF